MSLPKATPAPKLNNRSLLFFPYLYAFALLLLALWQLLSISMVGRAPFAFGDTPGWAMVIAGGEIFALPFLLRLNLSPLARAFSATLALVVPVALVSGMLYQMMYQVIDGVELYIVGGVVLQGFAAASFIILDGTKAVALTSKPLKKIRKR